MKRIIIYFIALSIVSSGLIISSCTKLEDTNYSDIISSEFNPTSSDIGALLAPAYASWRVVLFDDNWAGWFPANEVTADEYVIGAKPYGWVDDGVHRYMHEHTWSSENFYITGAWAGPYAGIANCNRLMYQIESGIITSDDAMIAELKVLRASYYYALCDQFGNIPIVTKFDVPEGYLPEQSSRAEVYDFLVTEITAALPFLTEDRSPATYGRFNSKWAAEALLAKIYLNAEIYSGTAQWDECLQACESIIGSGKFSLDAVQKNVFNATNENSPEIIWAIPYDVLYTTSPLYSLIMAKETRWTYNLKNNPSGGMTAVPQYIDTYNQNDLRYTKGWLMGQQYSSTGEILLCATGTLRGEPFNIINSSPGIDSNEVVHGLRLNKYEVLPNSYCWTQNNDFPFFRYTDILMMKAECLLRTGQADQAAAIVSEVRARSFTNNPELAAVTGSQLLEGSSYPYGLRNHFTTTNEGGADILYGGFLDELGWEFCAEGHRRQDMIRFGVFSTKSWLSHSVTHDLTRNIYPIPLAEMNKNPNLVQNPGY
jgi:starch-binding outer membrane protein, SusD/RagB family